MCANLQLKNVIFYFILFAQKDCKIHVRVCSFSDEIVVSLLYPTVNNCTKKTKRFLFFVNVTRKNESGVQYVWYTYPVTRIRPNGNDLRRPSPELKTQIYTATIHKESRQKLKKILLKTVFFFINQVTCF